MPTRADTSSVGEAKPPATVQVGPYLFEIIFDENEVNRQAVKDKRTLYGQMEPKEQRIYLDPTQGPDMLADTLLHELMHAALIPLDLDEDLEERAVSVAATSLLDTLRRNPKLVTFLLGA